MRSISLLLKYEILEKLVTYILKIKYRKKETKGEKKRIRKIVTEKNGETQTER